MMIQIVTSVAVNILNPGTNQIDTSITAITSNPISASVLPSYLKPTPNQALPTPNQLPPHVYVINVQKKN